MFGAKRSLPPSSELRREGPRVGQYKGWEDGRDERDGGVVVMEG